MSATRNELVRKAARVINSCVNQEQEQIADRYIELLQAELFQDEKKKILSPVTGCILAIIGGLLLAVGVIVGVMYLVRP